MIAQTKLRRWSISVARCSDRKSGTPFIDVVDGVGAKADTARRTFFGKLPSARTARVACLGGSALGAAGKGHLRFSYAASLDDIDYALEQIARCVPLFK
jgi:aspartate/methionine/tyrosine aminotransferase